MFGLKDLLNRNCALTTDGKDAFFSHDDIDQDTMFSPGYWVAYSARAHHRKLTVDELQIPDRLAHYARAIQIEFVLGANDSYPWERRNQGQNYSPLVVLESADRVDPATSTMCGCIRSQFLGDELNSFVLDVSDVIGDLHDNVWSHGMSTGISHSQRWRKRQVKGEHFFEFALADCGLGLFEELSRSGMAKLHNIRGHGDAIKWCIQKGNTSKPPPSDDWAQAIPLDSLSNPFPGTVYIAGDGNHHQGLGLFKLVNLVTRYSGELWLASGDAMLTIDVNGRHTYSRTAIPWRGVALACRFATDTVRKRAQPDTQADDIGTLLEQIVRGGK